MLPPAFLRGETPQRQHRPVVVALGVLGGVLVVLVVLELLLICVLDDHALHDLECSLHGSGVEGVLHVLLLLLDWLLILGPTLHLLLELSPLHVLPGLHIGVEDHPLSGLKGERGDLRGVGLDALLSQGQVEGLGGSLLEVELVPKRLLLCLLVALH